MILRYLTVSIIQVLLMAFQWVFSFLIALSVTRDGHLRFFPSLFEPTDSLAIGDQMYWDNEMAHTKSWPWWIRNYWLALNWGMRNPAYGYANLAACTMKGANDFYSTMPVSGPDIDTGDYGTVVGAVYREVINGDGKKYFEYRRIGRYSWSKNLVWYIQLGWSIPRDSLVDGNKCHLCVYIRPFCKG